MPSCLEVRKVNDSFHYGGGGYWIRRSIWRELSEEDVRIVGKTDSRTLERLERSMLKCFGNVEK